MSEMALGNLINVGVDVRNLGFCYENISNSRNSL